jgi:HTH-type transcriptional regulator, sugar sensing transcriptional regulator
MIKELKELGMSNGQIAVYSAVLELGISSLNNIHEKTGMERRNIYDILNKLIEKGMISYCIENKVRKYQCTHPNKIIEEIENKEEAITSLKNVMPLIMKQFSSSKSSIRAEVYRGNESIKAVFNEILIYKKSYWIGGNSGIEKTSLKNWFLNWMDIRERKKHYMYDLVDYKKNLQSTKNKDYKFYFRYELPKYLSSPMVIVIFGEKVAQITWSEQPFCFVLESKEIKNSFMKYFNYFWKHNK